MVTQCPPSRSLRRFLQRMKRNIPARIAQTNRSAPIIIPASAPLDRPESSFELVFVTTAVDVAVPKGLVVVIRLVTTDVEPLGKIDLNVVVNTDPDSGGVPATLITPPMEAPDDSALDADPEKANDFDNWSASLD
jgi:hypothetical protein